MLPSLLLLSMKNDTNPFRVEFFFFLFFIKRNYLSLLPILEIVENKEKGLIWVLHSIPTCGGGGCREISSTPMSNSPTPAGCPTIYPIRTLSTWRKRQISQVKGPVRPPNTSDANHRPRLFPVLQTC